MGLFWRAQAKIHAEIACSAPASSLAFTLAPHLQLINHRGRFSPLVGI
jgi:hypothetical protein